jgi:hypothetical protein
MTISANYPSIRPLLLLDFSNTKALDSRITFSRPTTATYYNATTSAVAEQNLFIYSQDFSGSGSIWGKSNVNITVAATTAPDGTTTGQKLVSTAVAASHPIYSNSGFSSNGYVISVYAKAAEYSLLQICDVSVGNINVSFDLTAVTSTISSGCSSATITSVGGGWYRCVAYLSVTLTSSTRLAFEGYPSTGVTPSAFGNSYTGDGTSGIYLWGAQLEQRSSVTAYTPTTTAAITNYIPVLLTQQANEARFDHNPTTRESLGLLIEEQRTNLLTYSSAFDNAAWTKTASSITATANVAPDGTQTAQLFIPNSGATIGSGTSLYQRVTLASGAIAISIYVKANQLTTCNLQDSSGNGANFNLSTGVVSSNTGTGVGSITSVGNGWYRCVVTIASISAANPYLYFYPTSGTANGFNGLYIWGAQLEAGAFPTSYIPTVASQVTRSADSASMTGTNFSSWYNNAEGSFYTELAAIGVSGFALTVSDGTTSNRAYQLLVNNATTFNTQVVKNGTTVVNITSSVTSVFTNNKISFGYKTNDFAISANGATVSTDTDGGIPTVNTLNFALLNGTSPPNITIKKLAYYPIRVTNTNLQSLTG